MMSLPFHADAWRYRIVPWTPRAWYFSGCLDIDGDVGNGADASVRLWPITSPFWQAGAPVLARYSTTETRAVAGHLTFVLKFKIFFNQLRNCFLLATKISVIEIFSCYSSLMVNIYYKSKHHTDNEVSLIPDSSISQKRFAKKGGAGGSV